MTPKKVQWGWYSNFPDEVTETGLWVDSVVDRGNEIQAIVIQENGTVINLPLKCIRRSRNESS
jgi:hypothetical protein